MPPTFSLPFFAPSDVSYRISSFSGWVWASLVHCQWAADARSISSFIKEKSEAAQEVKRESKVSILIMTVSYFSSISYAAELLSMPFWLMAKFSPSSLSTHLLSDCSIMKSFKILRSFFVPFCHSFLFFTLHSRFRHFPSSHVVVTAWIQIWEKSCCWLFSLNGWKIHWKCWTQRFFVFLRL